MREPLLTVCCGTKGVGKSYRTFQEINHYAKHHNRKVLIYDVNTEGIYSDLKTVSLNDINKLQNGEIRRVVPFHANKKEWNLEEKQEALFTILDKFRNGLLVIEDINKYLTSNVQGIVSAITTNRHKGIDIIIHLQSLSKMTTSFWENTNIVRFHYQMDNVDRYQDRIPNPELFKLAQIIVNNAYFQGSQKGKEHLKRYFVYVKNQENQIIGATAKQFKEACNTYLLQNPAIQKRLKSELNLKGDNLTVSDKVLNYFVKQKSYYLG